MSHLLSLCHLLPHVDAMIAKPRVWTIAKIVALSHVRHRVREIVLEDVKKHAAEDVKVLTKIKDAQTVVDHVRMIAQEVAKMVVLHHVLNHAVILVKICVQTDVK